MSHRTSPWLAALVLAAVAACGDTGGSGSDSTDAARSPRDGGGPVCGDGVVEGAEECDDQNRSGADGCDECRLVHASACEPCSSNADCGVFGTCVELTDGMWCATSCEEAPCPGGYACRERDGALLCEPVDRRCRPCPDDDGDRVCDDEDVCPGEDDRVDADEDGTPDGCDACPLDPAGDSDGDGICDTEDACPDGDDRIDDDGDGVPDGCDPCPRDSPDDSDSDGVCDSEDVCPDGDDGADADGDGIADACDPCDDRQDADGDGVCDALDPCPAANPDDADGDDICDDVDPCDDREDADGDGVCDALDPCPASNPDDADSDDICDDLDPCDDREDADGDGVCDALDACEGFDDDLDGDDDGIPDGCDRCDGDSDVDGDGVCDSADPCPLDNPDDSDGDGVCDSDDACPLDNPDDSDGDGVCDSDDACDGDDRIDTDGDGEPDACDRCPLSNPDDADADDVCDDVDRCLGGDDRDDADADGLPDRCDPCSTPANDVDTDRDGVCDDDDRCPGGDDEVDADGDGTPDACELDPGSYVYDRVALGGIGNLSVVAIAPDGRHALIADRTDELWVYERQSGRFAMTDVNLPGDDAFYWADIAFAPDGSYALLVGNRWDDGANAGPRAFRFDVAEWVATGSFDDALVEIGPSTRREVVEAVAFHPTTSEAVLLSRTNRSSYTVWLDTISPVDGTTTFRFAEPTSAGCTDVGYARNEIDGDGWLIACGVNGSDVLYYKEIGGVWEVTEPDTGSIGNVSRVLPHPSGDYALVIGWSADAIFRFERGVWTRVADYSTRRLWTGAFQPSGRRALVVGSYQSVFGDEFGSAFEYRNGFNECPIVLTPDCDVREVSIPFFGDPPFVAENGFQLNDVAWWPDCEGGLIVAGKSDFRGDQGLLISFQREGGASCTIPTGG